MCKQKELTVERIITIIKERRIKLYKDLYEPDAPTNVPSRMNELLDLLNHIEKGDEY